MARKVLGTNDSDAKFDRRKFLTGVAIAGAAGAVAPNVADATVAADKRLPSALPPVSFRLAH